MAARKQTGWTARTTAAAFEAELRELAKVDPALASSSLAMSALALARELENDGNSLTSRSEAQGRFREAEKELRERMPQQDAKDGLDELTARRAARIARGAAAKG